MRAILIVVLLRVAICTSAKPLCRLGEAESPDVVCEISGKGCKRRAARFDAHNLTVLQWDQASRQYSEVGQLEAHAIVGTAADPKLYLNGPMLRPQQERGSFDMPPFYAQATLANKVYRYEHIQRLGRGQPLLATEIFVAYANGPSTSFAIDDAQGNLQGLLLAQGQPFGLAGGQLDFGGVDYVSQNCTRVFPNKIDTGSRHRVGDVVNTVSCHPGTRICFFSVWKFFDDQPPVWNNVAQRIFGKDCLHYCVLDSNISTSIQCRKGGIVKYEDGTPICSQPGVGGVHSLTVDQRTNAEDPSKFNVFLVMTGGVSFSGGESSMQKLTCQQMTDGDLRVMKTLKNFGSELFQMNRATSTGLEPGDAGGDHAWVDSSGKYVWISTFRTHNPGIHMLDSETGKLIYTIPGVSDYSQFKYSTSAGITGLGSLNESGSVILVGTSNCNLTAACGPLPEIPGAPMLSTGIMYVIDISEFLSKPKMAVTLV